MNRRGFLAGMLAAAAAPALVSACNIMRTKPIFHLEDGLVWTPASGSLDGLWSQWIAEKFRESVAFGENVSRDYDGVIIHRGNAEPSGVLWREGNFDDLVKVIDGDIGRYEGFRIYESKSLPRVRNRT